MAFYFGENPDMDIAKIISINLTALMDGTPALDTIKKVEQKSGVGFGTIRRAKKGDANITVEKLTAIAKAFKRHPAELMIEQPSTLSPPAIANYSNVIEGCATRLEANEPAALAEIIDLPPPLLSELIEVAKAISDTGLHRLIGQAQQLAEQFPKDSKTNAAS